MNYRIIHDKCKTFKERDNQSTCREASQIFDVGRLKVQFPKLSMIDAQVLTLGKRTNSFVLTTDEYLKVVSKQVLKFEY